jgi:hypothetical protein
MREGLTNLFPLTMEKWNDRDNPQERLILDTTNFKIGWLAAMLDGEGSISLYASTHGYKQSYYKIDVATCISGSDKESIGRTVQYLHDLGMSCYAFTFQNPPTRITNSGLVKTYTKKIATIRVWGHKRNLRFLTMIEPFLTEKRERAKNALRFIHLRDGCEIKRQPNGRIIKGEYTIEELSLYWKMRQLNGTINKYRASKSSESIRRATYSKFRENNMLKMYSELTGDSQSSMETYCPTLPSASMVRGVT